MSKGLDMERKKKCLKRILAGILAVSFVLPSSWQVSSKQVKAADEARQIPAEGKFREPKHRQKDFSSMKSRSAYVKTDGDGKSQTVEFSVTSLSSDGYSDSVSWELKSVSCTGDGRSGADDYTAKLVSNGNTLKVEMSGLLDYETYEVIVKYSQTYYWDQEHKDPYIDKNGKPQVNEYTTKEDSTTSGEKESSFTTSKDSNIRNASDLNEKVHKYKELKLANDIALGSLNCSVDGASRKSWLHEDISSISIDGNNKTVTRDTPGSTFHVHSGGKLSLSDIGINAYLGTLIQTATDGNEYVTLNATGGAEGVGILVGNDPSTEGGSASSGFLTLRNANITAGKCGVIVRYGSADISGSTIYGMGAKDVYDAPSDDEYYGTGLDITSDSLNKCNVKVDDSNVYGRFNAVFQRGGSDLTITDSLIRGDCGDAFDFRGTGKLDISGCSIYGVNGLDIFNDATYHGVYKAINTTDGSFDNKAFSERVPSDKDKGNVSISDTSMDLYTGPFAAIAGKGASGIVNRGKLGIGSKVSIRVRHSSVWSSTGSDPSEAVGIYNVSELTLPDDIYIDAADDGIVCSRNIGVIRSAMPLYYNDSVDAAAIERMAASHKEIFDYLDDGSHSSVKLTGGTIAGKNAGIVSHYGSVTMTQEKPLFVRGENYGVALGKNGYDNIFGSDAMPVTLIVDGKDTAYIRSSVQGIGLLLRDTARAELVSDTVITGTQDRVGRGIVNRGWMIIKNADISASECGIRNESYGRIYMGDELLEEDNTISIIGSVYGIYNKGRINYYRNIIIKESKRAAVWQNGIFYMLSGAVVTPANDSKNVIYLRPGRTIRLLYDEPEAEFICETEGTILTDVNDRRPGRVVIEAYSADGNTDLSDESYTDIDEDEKKAITDELTGFDLAFDKVKDHKASLRSGLGDYEDRSTNGRCGTLVLSCLLSARYDADFPVKNDHISSVDPEATQFYWKEPTEFTVASDIYGTDRSRIYYDKTDITAGLIQKGWRDRLSDGSYGSNIYSAGRITEIYGDDHTFCGVWDSGFDILFDGNGQTNGAANYSTGPVNTRYVMPGNTGPDGRTYDYFTRYINVDDMRHSVSFYGWSMDSEAIYKDHGIWREGDVVDDTLSLYTDAAGSGNLNIADGKATVRLYAVWDEYPVITACDSYFYADELSDPDSIRRKLLDNEVVSATDACDGDLPQQRINVYSDAENKTFSVNDFTGLGDIGNTTVFYSVSDNNGNTSMCTATVYIMTEESEDTGDDIPTDTPKGRSGSSSDTVYSSPIYVRNIDVDNRDTLITHSVWREDGYDHVLDTATDSDEVIEKWHFTDSDITETRKMLYEDNASASAWRTHFISRRTLDNRSANEENNKSLIIDEGLSSLRITWDLKSETDQIIVNLIPETATTVTKEITRNKNEKMASSVTVNDLKPGMNYRIEVDFYYKGSFVKAFSGSATTGSLAVPQAEIQTDDNGSSMDVHILIRRDEYAMRYMIERKRLNSKVNSWEQIAVLNNTEDDLIRYTDHISDEGIYRYRVRSAGKRLGLATYEESAYSIEYETGFVRQPVIESLQPGCRSIGVDLSDMTVADSITTYYSGNDGAVMHTEFRDPDAIVISDERLTDNTVYEISLMAHITSPESGKRYSSLMSIKRRAKTYTLTEPDFRSRSYSDIYSVRGNQIRFKTDRRAERYEIDIQKVYPDAGDKVTKTVRANGRYLHRPDSSGIYSYTVRAFYNTLDGKTFSTDSGELKTAYIIPQTYTSKTVTKGTNDVVGISYDPDVDGYLLTVQESGHSSEKIYVSQKDETISTGITAIKKNVRVLDTVAVIFYEGREYKGKSIRNRQA